MEEILKLLRIGKRVILFHLFILLWCKYPLQLFYTLLKISSIHLYALTNFLTGMFMWMHTHANMHNCSVIYNSHLGPMTTWIWNKVAKCNILKLTWRWFVKRSVHLDWKCQKPKWMDFRKMITSSMDVRLGKKILVPFGSWKYILVQHLQKDFGNVYQKSF